MRMLPASWLTQNWTRAVGNSSMLGKQQFDMTRKRNDNTSKKILYASKMQKYSI